MGESEPRSAAVGLVVRRTWQTGWRSQLVLAITVATTVGVVLGVLAGAQRAESALDRLRSQSHASDVMLVSGPGGEARLGTLAAADGVASVGALRELFVRPAGSDLFPDYNLLAVAPSPTEEGDMVDVPVIVSGRAPDPSTVDEVALSEGLAAALHLHVGDRFDLESMTSAWVDIAFNGGDAGPPDGPTVKVEVVGLARSAADFGRWSGLIHLTPAYAARYQDQVHAYTVLSARLTSPGNGESLDLPGVGRDEVRPSFFAWSPATADGLRTIAVGLQLVAAISALAGLTAIALTMLRLARASLAERSTLAAIGWTRSEMVRTVVLALVPSLLAGLVVGTALGVWGSPRTSIGLARAVDPTPDATLVARPLTLVVTAAAVVVLGALVVIAGSRASRPAVAAAPVERPAGALRRPLAVTLGLRRAIFGAPERGGRASRSAVAAATAAVLVAVAALIVGSSIQRLQGDPSLSGQGGAAQKVIDAGEDPAVYDRAMAKLDGDPRAADLIGLHVAFGISALGVPDATALIYDVRRGDPGASLLRGRLAAQPDEVAVGPTTLDAMGLSVGDAVTLSAQGNRARFHIVGEVLFPEGDFTHDTGVAITLGGAGFLGGIEGTAIHQVAFSWAPGVDAGAADRALGDAGFSVFSTRESVVPAVVSNLDEVRRLPGLLAGLVLVLGLLTVVHAVSQTTRLRQREAGTLRALGVTPVVVAFTVAAQGAAVVVLAVAGGLPLGLAGGRKLWSLIAGRAHVVDHPVVPWTGLGWTLLLVLLAAALLVLPLAGRAARQRPSVALRAE